MMPRQTTHNISLVRLLAGCICCLLALAACGQASSTPNTTPAINLPIFTAPSATPSPSPAPTATPTATPLPLAVQVNDTGLLLSDFQSELTRYQTAFPDASASQARDDVLNSLVEEILLAQGAAAEGFVLDGAALQSRYDALAAAAGDAAALESRLSVLGYTPDSFQRTMARQAAAAWMRDQIIQSVSHQAEQVHALQILLYNSEEANQVYAQLQSGTRFATLAEAYDPLTSGDLGWFPRGYLFEPALETAAFNLVDDAFSEIIETRLGYHIVQVIERDQARTLTPEAYRQLQAAHLAQWLQQRKEASTIQVLLP